jgi:hypothetical protein
MGHTFAMSISKGSMHLSISWRKTCWTTLEGIFVVLANIARMRRHIALRSYLIKHGFMEDYWCWNKHGDEGFNEAEMRAYLEREVPTGVKEDHDDDVNEPDILGFTDDDIEF